MNFVQIDLNVQDHSRISLKQSRKTRVALWAGAHELDRHTIFRNYSHTQHVWYSTPIVNAQHHSAGKLCLNLVPTNLTSWGDLLSGCQQWIPVHVMRSTKAQRGPGFWALGCKMNDSLDQTWSHITWNLTLSLCGHLCQWSLGMWILWWRVPLSQGPWSVKVRSILVLLHHLTSKTKTPILVHQKTALTTQSCVVGRYQEDVSNDNCINWIGNWCKCFSLYRNFIYYMCRGHFWRDSGIPSNYLLRLCAFVWVCGLNAIKPKRNTVRLKTRFLTLHISTCIRRNICFIYVKYM